MSEWLDPRWEWIEIRTWGDSKPRYVMGACNHLEVIDVHSGDTLTNGLGEQGPLVARLCLTCDAQLSANG